MMKVSILIVSRNSRDDLVRLFNSIKKLTYPKRMMEVVYVDDASFDGSIEVAKKFGARVYAFKKRQGRAKVRNFALSKARYPVIAWIDSDCEIVDKNWIQNMAKHLKGNVIGVAGNQLKPSKGLSRIAWYLPGMAVMVKKEKFASWAPTTSSMFVKKPLLQAKFNGKLITAEDLEVCWRLAKKGYRFKQIPQAQIIHHFRTTFLKFAEQHYERGIFGGHLMRDYGTLLSRIVSRLSFMSIPLLLALFVSFPVATLSLLALFPLFVYVGLGNVGFFPSVISNYIKSEKSFAGVLKLTALQYVRTFTLLGGLIAFSLRNLAGKA
jgi:glycosyltransferase involved in cell wall biosynthesis